MQREAVGVPRVSPRQLAAHGRPAAASLPRVRTMSDRPYSRVYWEVRSDERFVGIYSDNHHLATWLRLLIAADMAWPEPADLPASVRRASLAALSACGLIELLPAHMFRVHGLDKERNARSAKARASVMHRYNDRTTTVERSKYDRSTSRDELRRDEPSVTREGLYAITGEVAAAWETATGRTVLASGKFAQDYLDDAAHRHGFEKVVAAIAGARATFEHVPSTQALTAAVRNRLDPLPSGRPDDTAEREERDRAASTRRVQATLAKVHGYGGHEDTPSPQCSLCRGAA